MNEYYFNINVPTTLMRAYLSISNTKKITIIINLLNLEFKCRDFTSEL